MKVEGVNDLVPLVIDVQQLQKTIAIFNESDGVFEKARNSILAFSKLVDNLGRIRLFLEVCS